MTECGQWKLKLCLILVVHGVKTVNVVLILSYTTYSSWKCETQWSRAIIDPGARFLSYTRYIGIRNSIPSTLRKIRLLSQLKEQKG